MILLPPFGRDNVNQMAQVNTTNGVDAADTGLYPPPECPAIHVAALMRALLIVDGEMLVENGLHLLGGREPGSALLNLKCLS